MVENKTGNSDLISRHIFLFPFKWETAAEKGATFTQRTNLDTFESKLLSNDNSVAAANKLLWKRRHFDLSRLNQFNEFSYYYDYVREILYDLHGDDTTKAPLYNPTAGGSLLRHYELSSSEKLTYRIVVSVKEEEKDEKEKGNAEKQEPAYERRHYDLDVDSVTLNVYETGIAVLVFFLGNRDETQNQPEDILRINQFGRRVSPPFFGVDIEEVGVSFNENKEEDVIQRLRDTQRTELALSIGIGKGKDESFLPVFTEAFSVYHQKAQFVHGPFLLPVFISALFTKEKIITQEACWKPDSDAILIKPVLDDRMFVASWYGGKKILENRITQNLNEELAKFGVPASAELQEEFDYLNTRTKEGAFWYKFTFVDGGGMSSTNHAFASKELEKRTYNRWLPYTYYGVTRYSLVCFTDSLHALKGQEVGYLPQHLESIYYKLFELCIVQRASVLRFADEVTHFSHFAELGKEDRMKNLPILSEQVTDLYQNYIRFINKVYFREVTAQDQGIEMYDMLQKHMRIEIQVEDLDGEINELHTYVSLLAQRESEERDRQEAKDKADRDSQEQKRADRTQQKLNALGVLATVIGLPGAILGFYGLSFYEAHFEAVADTRLWFALLFGLLILLSLTTLKAFRLKLRIQKQAADYSAETEKKPIDWPFATLALSIAGILIALPFFWTPLPQDDKESSERTVEEQAPVHPLEGTTESQSELPTNDSTDILNPTDSTPDNPPQQ